VFAKCIEIQVRLIYIYTHTHIYIHRYIQTHTESMCHMIHWCYRTVVEMAGSGWLTLKGLGLITFRAGWKESRHITCVRVWGGTVAETRWPRQVLSQFLAEGHRRQRRVWRPQTARSSYSAFRGPKKLRNNSLKANSPTSKCGFQAKNGRVWRAPTLVLPRILLSTPDQPSSTKQRDYLRKRFREIVAFPPQTHTSAAEWPADADRSEYIL